MVRVDFAKQRSRSLIDYTHTHIILPSIAIILFSTGMKCVDPTQTVGSVHGGV